MVVLHYLKYYLVYVFFHGQLQISQDIGEGMYLEDLLSVDEEVANLYLQQSDRFLL